MKHGETFQMDLLWAVWGQVLAGVERWLREGHVGWEMKAVSLRSMPTLGAIKPRRRWGTRRVAATLFVAMAVCAEGQINDHSGGLDQGYFDMYNVNFAAAHGVFQQWLAQHPEDGLAAASDAAAYLFGEFDRLHIIDVQLFADQSRFDSRSKLTPDPAARKAFDDRTAQATRLADEALQKNPKDARAFYTKTLVYGMQSDYALMIDRKDLAALTLTKQASSYAKQALAVQPDLYDAYLASGVENYMLSLKPAPIRWLLGVTGAETDKEQGIKLLEKTASQGHYLAPFARMMLAVAAIRDGNPGQARAILTALMKQFPGNTLYARQLERIH